MTNFSCEVIEFTISPLTKKRLVTVALQYPRFIHSELIWDSAKTTAVQHARHLQALSLHKQIVNRLIEPFQVMKTLVTSTEWENFFTLRCSPMAQPEMCHLADLMNDTLNSVFDPLPEDFHHAIGHWHLPFVTEDERKVYELSDLALISAARCARVSYMNHDNTNPDLDKDIELANKLRESGHWSPFEHQAVVSVHADGWFRNFQGYEQHRAMIGG